MSQWIEEAAAEISVAIDSLAIGAREADEIAAIIEKHSRVLAGEVERLRKACQAFVQAAKDAHDHWDADRDAKVGKLLSAMAGYLTNYRPELTEAHKAIAEVQP